MYVLHPIFDLQKKFIIMQKKLRKIVDFFANFVYNNCVPAVKVCFP